MSSETTGDVGAGAVANEAQTALAAPAPAGPPTSPAAAGDARAATVPLAILTPEAEAALAASNGDTEAGEPTAELVQAGEATRTAPLASLTDAAGASGPAEAVQQSEWAEAAEAEAAEGDEPAEFEPPRRLRTVLLALGFFLAALAVIAAAIAAVGYVTHGFKKPVKITYKKSPIFGLRTGQCVDPNGQSAAIVSCDTPHDAEVYATFTLPDGPWPGTTAVGAAASSGCQTRLTGYINPELAISVSAAYVYPDSVSWKAGTRTVICEVRATSGQLTGSVKGATATDGSATTGGVSVSVSDAVSPATSSPHFPTASSAAVLAPAGSYPPPGSGTRPSAPASTKAAAGQPATARPTAIVRPTGIVAPTSVTGPAATAGPSDTAQPGDSASATPATGLSDGPTTEPGPELPARNESWVRRREGRVPARPDQGATVFAAGERATGDPGRCCC